MDPLTQRAIDLARQLHDEAGDLDTPLKRLISNPNMMAFAVEVTDQAFRSPSRQNEQIAYLAKKHGMSWLYSRPKLVAWLIQRGMRRVILPGETDKLLPALTKLSSKGICVNLNRLGEAILGEREAEQRLALYIDDLSHPEIDYISVKISTLCSQLNLVGFDDTLETLSSRFNLLLDAAGDKFINLDMEHYRDVKLTVALFKKVLSQRENAAGIVLQAYCPDSFAIQKELTEWAKTRVGKPIKIRIVRGANLAMEQVEASVHGWSQAPFETKLDVDINFGRMVEYAAHNTRHVHVGIATHNLFDIAYAMLLREDLGLEHEMTFEMLQGMAEPLQKAVLQRTGSLLLYCPAARQSELNNAIAYLVRRLDENAGPKNFLHHLCTGKPTWEELAHSFSTKTRLPETPRRTLDRPDLEPNAPFRNEPDTDWASTDTIQPIEGKGTTPAQILRRRRQKLVDIIVSEGKKTIAEADTEVSEAVDFCEYYQRQYDHLKNDPEVEWRPKGTIAVITPWNFPVAIPVGGIIAALITGNKVVFKPAPETVECGRLVAQIFWDAGYTKRQLKFYPCPETPAGDKLVKTVDAVIFTGSTATARHFLSLRPDLDLIGETGGKNTMIISNMADRDLAIEDLVSSAYGHAGQKCSATSLAILHYELYDDPKFLGALKDAAMSLKSGPAHDKSTTIPPTMHETPITLEPGEEFLCPRIKLGVTKNSYTHQTELFGPLLGVMRAESLDHALELANATPYGLTAGIHTLDEREIDTWLDKMVAGNLYINRPTTGAIVGRQPFGGTKLSSFGPGLKAGGPHYLTQLMLPTQTRPSQTSDAQALAMLPKHLQNTLGEQNTLRYTPRNISLRLLPGDDPTQISRIIDALTICRCTYTISRSPKAPPHPDALTESDADFLSKPHHRIRTLQKPPASYFPHNIIHTTPLSSGRYELLHYLFETTISHTTHRYGHRYGHLVAQKSAMV